MHWLMPWQNPQQTLTAHQMLWRVNNYHQIILRKTLRKHKITYIEYAIVAELLLQQKAMAGSYQQLATALHTDHSTIAKAMRRVRTKGFICFHKRDIFDRRAWSIQASRLGAHLVDEIHGETIHFEQELVTLLGSGALKKLEKLYDQSIALERKPKAKAHWRKVVQALRR